MPWREPEWAVSFLMEILKWCNSGCQPRNVSFCHLFFVALKITSIFSSVIFSFLCSPYSTCCSSSNFWFPVGLWMLSVLENATLLFGWRRQDRLCVRSQVRGRVEKVRQWLVSLLLDVSQLNSSFLCMLQTASVVCSFSVQKRKPQFTTSDRNLAAALLLFE